MGWAIEPFPRILESYANQGISYGLLRDTLVHRLCGMEF